MIRSPGRFLLAGILLLASVPGAPRAAVSAAGHRLSGIAADPLGRLLSGVEILVLSEATGAVPIAIVRTDEAGRYAVSDLAPGAYRVAAVKDGYLTFLGRVNTLVRATMDLVLLPAPATQLEESGEPAHDRSWVLRLPSRSVLRETEASGEIAEARGGPPAWLPAVADGIGGTLEHVSSLGSDSPGGSAHVRGLSARSTRYAVSGLLGSRGSVRIQGGRERREGSVARDSGEVAASDDGSALSLDLGYDTGLDSRLAVRAFRAERETGIGDGRTGPSRRGYRTTGGSATWSAQVDATSRLALSLGYDEDLLDLEDAALQEPRSGGDASQRKLELTAEYEGRAASGHRVRAGLRTRRVEGPLLALSGAIDGATPALASDPGWSARLEARDDWSLAGPLSLVVGMGLDCRAGGGGRTRWEPRAGGAWAGRALNARLVVGYDAESGAGNEFPAGAGVSAPGLDGIAYEAVVEVPIADRIRIRGAAVQAIAGSSFLDGNDTGHLPGTIGIGAAEGRARLREESLALEQDGGPVRVYARWARGEAGGLLASAGPVDLPVRSLGLRRLSYRDGLVGLRVPAFGTDVAATYRSVEEVSPEGSEGSVRRGQRWVELRVAQDLARWPTRGISCRFLLAARATPWRDEGPKGNAESDDAAALASLARGVSAGVSVLF